MIKNTYTSEIKNNSVPLVISEIPVLDYGRFYDQVTEILRDTERHCMTYFCTVSKNSMKFYICIADDRDNTIQIFCHEQNRGEVILESLTKVCPQMHIFERGIHEKYGVGFEGHPWLKPVRYPFDRHDRSKNMDNYPFYSIDSGELHEVGVGPVHAGVIEPGHFRFICNGEKVLHLEIQLGYQHRGIEKLFTVKKNALQRSILAESIAGDTAVGHSLAHAQLIETLSGIEVSESVQIERCIALELERLAVHIGDTAALCGDVAYQLGQAVCETLRTSIINSTQLWCGNRFGKGLVRPGGTNYPLNNEIADSILNVLDDTQKRFIEITDRIYSLPSLLARFEDIGRVTRQQVLDAGAVGMAARMAGIERDIRKTHPFQYFRNYSVTPVLQTTGDVYARGMIRKLEAVESFRIICDLTGIWRKADHKPMKPIYDYKLKPDSFGISAVEGWRGEICHIALTDNKGEMVIYKVKDPSVHNWTALALAVRNQEISDFPVNNKSFNLSYCGHDL